MELVVPATEISAQPYQEISQWHLSLPDLIWSAMTAMTVGLWKCKSNGSCDKVRESFWSLPSFGAGCCPHASVAHQESHSRKVSLWMVVDKKYQSSLRSFPKLETDNLLENAAHHLFSMGHLTIRSRKNTKSNSGKNTNREKKTLSPFLLTVYPSYHERCKPNVILSSQSHHHFYGC